MIRMKRVSCAWRLIRSVVHASFPALLPLLFCLPHAARGRSRRQRPPPSWRWLIRSSAPGRTATPFPARPCPSAWCNCPRTPRFELQAELQVGRGLPLRRHDDPGLLAHAFFRHRAFRSGRRAAPAHRRRCAAGPRRDRQARGRLPLALQPQAGAGRARLLRGDLLDYGIHVELTATARVGVHRYTFPAGKPAHVLVDLRSTIYNYPGKVLWSRLRIRDDGTVTGMRETRGWAPGRQLYFAMRFSQPMQQHSLYDREPSPVDYHGFKTPGNDSGRHAGDRRPRYCRRVRFQPRTASLSW